ncbi:MAG: tRNA pseudouridine(13) synthase TruD [Phycisphaerales bacterium]
MAIRRSPEDFRVDERLAPGFHDALAGSPDAAHPHALVRLTKTSLTTPDACAHLARVLRVPVGAVVAAGLKDRHAVTAQHCTVRAPGPEAARALERSPEGHGWRALLLGWSAQPIDASAIEANEFEIVVRGLHAAEVQAMHARAAALAADGGGGAPRTLLLANYFGDQRFGGARHGRGFAAQSLVAGDFLQAIRLLVGTPARKDHGTQRAFTRACATHWGEWKTLLAALPRRPERRAFEILARGGDPAEAFVALPNFLQTMCIEAFQSLLWNDALRRLHAALGEPLLRTPDDFGELLFAPATRVPAAWHDAAMPMPSPAMAPAPPWDAAMRAALEAHGVEAASLRVPGLHRPFFGHAERPMLVRAMDVELRDEGADPTQRSRRVVRARFALPRGAYATVVLRALGQ